MEIDIVFNNFFSIYDATDMIQHMLIMLTIVYSTSSFTTEITLTYKGSVQKDCSRAWVVSKNEKVGSFYI